MERSLLSTAAVSLVSGHVFVQKTAAPVKAIVQLLQLMYAYLPQPRCGVVVLMLQQVNFCFERKVAL